MQAGPILQYKDAPSEAALHIRYLLLEGSCHTSALYPTRHTQVKVLWKFSAATVACVNDRSARHICMKPAYLRIGRARPETAVPGEIVHTLRQPRSYLTRQCRRRRRCGTEVIPPSVYWKQVAIILRARHGLCVVSEGAQHVIIQEACTLHFLLPSCR